MASNFAHLRINEAALIAELTKYIIGALEEATEHLLGIMAKEIMRTVHGRGPGKPEWREALAGELREVYRDVAEEAIEFGVGLPYSSFEESGYKLIRAMVVAYGSGSEAGGEAIHTKPGELVWDGDLESKGLSDAKSWYLLPEGFNQAGNEFVENSMKIMRAHFKSILESSFAKIPQDVFWRNVHVVQ